MNLKNISLIIPLFYVSLKVAAGPVNNKTVDLSFYSESDNEVSSLEEDIELIDDDVKVVDIFHDDENIATEIIDIDEEEVCSSEQCIQISKRILSNLDTSVNPCDDFYQFTCGGWKSKFNSNESDINALIDKEVCEILESEYVANEKLSKEDQEYDEKTFKKLKNMYTLCMNNEFNESFPNEYLINFIKNLNIEENKDNLKDTEALTNLLIKLRTNGIYSFFQLYSTLEENISDRQIVGLRHSYTIHNHLTFIKLTETKSEFIPIYKNYIKTIITSILGDKTNIDSVVDSIFSTEKKLIKLVVEYMVMMMKGEEQSEDGEALKLSELNEKYPLINWKSYIKYVLEHYNLNEYVKDDMIIYNQHSTYIEGIQKLINEMTVDDIVNYLEWTAITQMIEYFSDKNYISGDIIEAEKILNEEMEKLLMTLSPEEINEVLYLGFDFSGYMDMDLDEITSNLKLINENGNNLRKREGMEIEKGEVKENEEEEEKESRHSLCLMYIEGIMPMAISKYFIEKNFNNDIKSEIENIVKNIKEAMINRIPKIEWLDDETKQHALEKVLKMKERIGYPDDILIPKKLYERYENIEIDNLFDLFTQFKILSDDYYLKVIGNNEWRMPPHYPSAYYDKETNSINLPIAYFQSPIYESNGQDYINYGSAGYIIGHELTHAFDTIGKYYDAEGHFNNWWTDNDDEEFYEYSQCFIDEYNSFTYKVNNRELNVIGEHTLAENIADNGGFTRAYDAWQLSLLNNNSEKSVERNKKLPGLENYTIDQLFFIAFGQSHCSSGNYNIYDRHSPKFARVNGVVANSKDFAKAFKCQTGDHMNPENKCVIW